MRNSRGANLTIIRFSDFEAPDGPGTVRREDFSFFRVFRGLSTKGTKDTKKERNAEGAENAEILAISAFNCAVLKFMVLPFG